MMQNAARRRDLYHSRVRCVRSGQRRVDDRVRGHGDTILRVCGYKKWISISRGIIVMGEVHAADSLLFVSTWGQTRSQGPRKERSVEPDVCREMKRHSEK